MLQGMISPLSLGDNTKERWTEDTESAFSSLKLPGVESPRRKSTLRCALELCLQDDAWTAEGDCVPASHGLKAC